MKFRRLFSDPIDPALGLSEEELRKVRNRIHLRVDAERAARMHGPNKWIFALAPSLLYMLVMVPIFTLQPGWWYIFLLIPTLMFSVVIGIVVMQRWARRPLVILALRHYGYEVCFRCGYYLVGLPDDALKCPECGAAREELEQSASGERDYENIASARE